jgi:hypothetical protein
LENDVFWRCAGDDFYDYLPLCDGRNRGEASMVILQLFCLPWYLYVLYFRPETDRLTDVYWNACVNPGANILDNSGHSTGQ